MRKYLVYLLFVPLLQQRNGRDYKLTWSSLSTRSAAHLCSTRFHLQKIPIHASETEPRLAEGCLLKDVQVVGARYRINDVSITVATAIPPEAYIT